MKEEYSVGKGFVERYTDSRGVVFDVSLWEGGKGYINEFS
jgi:hypothetical protein